jgi:hypothetical protein
VRRAARIDNNHEAIVRALRAIGASVQPLASMGHGVPDLLVGWRGKNMLIEVKDGSLVPSKRQLTLDEEKWHANWAGQVAIAESVEDAVIRVIAEAERQ